MITADDWRRSPGEAAKECGRRADSDRNLVLLAEDVVSLLEGAGAEWAALGGAWIERVRADPRASALAGAQDDEL